MASVLAKVQHVGPHQPQVVHRLQLSPWTKWQRDENWHYGKMLMYGISKVALIFTFYSFLVLTQFFRFILTVTSHFKGVHRDRDPEWPNKEVTRTVFTLMLMGAAGQIWSSSYKEKPQSLTRECIWHDSLLLYPDKGLLWFKWQFWSHFLEIEPARFIRS